MTEIMRWRQMAAHALHSRWAVRVVVACAALVVVAPASAHVVVLPSVVPEGSPTEFTLEVPTAVRVVFPPQVSVYSFQVPPPGFTVTPVYAKNQSLIGVIYRGTIPVGDYEDFHFLGTPFSTGQTLWPAYQTYADGLVKPWDGPPEAPGAVSVENGATQPGPTSAVQVVAAGTATTSGTQSSGLTATTSGGSSSGTSVWLGVIAVVIALGAAAAVGLLWATRPVRLPDDDPDPPAR
jgi:uncharacterized protein YcnI